MFFQIFPKRLTIPVIVILFFVYFTFWWFYKLEVLPGLHGDEAWVGLSAIKYKTHPLDRLAGMTYYTGILQNLIAELSFKLFGLGVYQLRIPGAVINLIALTLIISTFLLNRLCEEAVLFLVMLGASSLYIISPRIAWEVNTFTLLFVALSFVSLMAIYRSGKKSGLFWISLFWLSSIVGSYNHIIYSCLSVAFFLGTILWGTQRDTELSGKVLIVSGFNFFNVVTVYLLQRYNLNYILLHISYLPIFLGGPLMLELTVYYWLPDFKIKIGFLNPRFNYSIFFLLIIVFTYYHGRGFFDVLSNYKFIIQAYSYECSFVFKMAFIVGAIGFIFMAAKILWNNFVKNNTNNLFALVIVSYMALLALYTTKNSLRYYLVLYAILCLYMAFKLSWKQKLVKVFIGTQLILMTLVNAMLLDIFIHNPIPVKAVDFLIGNGQVETSSAFLSKKPIIDFLKANQVSKINYMCYPYFIEQPIEFYKKIAPWKERAKDSVLIDYNYNRYNSGFLLIKTR